MKRIGMLMFLVGILMCAVVSAVPVTLEEVSIDNVDLDYGDVNKLDLERGDKFDIKVKLSASDDADDVEVVAFISGYEYNDRESLSDTTHVFDVENGTNYIKKLQLGIPSNVDDDTYKLRIMVSDRDGTELIQNYNLKISAPRHELAIKDVIFSPENNVQAGRALLATVRVKNLGDKDEEGIKIKVSVPELGISASDYIDELEADESTTSEELYMRIPTCARSGSYNVDITVEYDEGYEQISEEDSIQVLEGEMCEVIPPAAKTTIAYSADVQSLVAGEAGAAYPVTISNLGTSTKTYTIGVEGADWATVRVTPSNVLVLKAGETKTAYIYVAAKETAVAGDQVFTAAVKDASGNTLKELTLRASVEEASGMDWGTTRKVLEIALVALVVLLVIVGLIVAFMRLKGPGAEGEESQTYY
ncbi:MAG: hypothetical protein GY861_08955 [bacterium]|nr:hypothetical protein [bacterium]